MSQLAPAQAGQIDLPADGVSNKLLVRQLLWLALPVLAEHVLHMLVGLTDTYLANHLHRYTAVDALAAEQQLRDSANAAAAVGTMAYILWFLGLFTGAIGTGSTAIIARASGARHRRLANSICGQSVTVALFLGLGLGAFMYLASDLISSVSRLHGQAQAYADSYLRLLAIALPFSSVMFIANACLRGAGDTLTPAISMTIVDVVNIALSFGLTYGWWGLPQMGFQGIAMGTVIAYICGGLLQFFVLLYGRGGIRLFLHRMRPHWHNMRRLLRIGLPSALEGLIHWAANFGLLIVINHMDRSHISAAAHANAIRIESISYMAGFAVATAAATMVGQSLGMRNPRRAARSGYLAYALGGGLMTLCGVFFIFFAAYPARLMSDHPEVVRLTTICLFMTGFIQFGFAAAAVFGGALRGAGDTFAVMLINLSSAIFIRLAGVLIVALWLDLGLIAIWAVLCGELVIRGTMIYARFLHGGWKKIQV